MHHLAPSPQDHPGHSLEPRKLTEHLEMPMMEAHHYLQKVSRWRDQRELTERWLGGRDLRSDPSYVFQTSKRKVVRLRKRKHSQPGHHRMAERTYCEGLHRTW